MFCHYTEQFIVPFQHHLDVYLLYMHQTQPPRTDKFYAQTPATTGCVYPHHPSAITPDLAEFCRYHNTFGPSAIKFLLDAPFHNKQHLNHSL